MYTEEYEDRGFPFRDFLLKLILIIIFVFLLIWLLPKFITPTIKSCEGNKCQDISPLTSQIFADNLEKMKNAAISYYTNERLPQEVGDSYTLTLGDMIGLKLITPLIDKNNKACDVEKSYVKITKMDNEYLLKVNLKSSDKEDYILVHLGCYNYCNSDVCEKKYTNVKVKGSKPQKIVSIKKNNNGQTSNNPSSPSNPTNPDNPKPSDPKPTPPEEEPGYIYEYKKTTGAKFSKWTSWSSWSKTSCSTKEINCNDKDVTCLKKLQRLDAKRKVGTYTKEYTTTRQVLKQTGSYQQKSCSKYNYVVINNITYATTTTTRYETINNVYKETNNSGGSWIYQGTASYKNPPRDTATTSYKFVGADYSYCQDTCTSLPNYYYAKYTLSNGASTVTNTTSTPGQTTSSSETTSSSNVTVSASCGSYVTKTIPIYGYITVTEKASREEPMYGTVCYQSTKTRTLEKKGSSKTKWSKYDDKDLLNDGWYYTGNKKKAK